MNTTLIFWLRLSLSFLWILTAFTSLYWGHDIGYHTLLKAGVSGAEAELCIYLGAGCNFLLGGWLLSGWKPKLCYLLQIALVLVYTVLLSIVDSSYWLHPFGPLSKNLPIIGLLALLYKTPVRTVLTKEE